MIFAVILPIILPIIAFICLLGAYRPSTFSRFLLAATGVVLLLFTLWYVAAFIFGF